MNHLAHCVLSGGDEAVLLGNFIGDYVKGNDWQDYPLGVQRGLLLHRRIDAFTDSHPSVLTCVHRIRPFGKRYSGPICDILFDHVLTRQWSLHYPAQTLDAFVATTYPALLRRVADMPAHLQVSLPRMVEGDFLRGYGDRQGLEFVFGKFSRRLPMGFDWTGLLDSFFENLPDFEADFRVFFPQLQNEARTFLS
jgi:acyl carrier protein phosphodiesterase